MVIDGNGCIGSMSEFVNEVIEFLLVIFGDLDFCFGLIMILNVGNGFNIYLWFMGESIMSIMVDELGIYMLNVMDVGGCEGEVIVEVIENLLLILMISGDFDYCVGFFMQISVNLGYISYEWSIGVLMVMIIVNLLGNYLVEVVDNNGCINFIDVDVIEQSLFVFDIVGLMNFCVDLFIML